jgi:hypothetical protein
MLRLWLVLAYSYYREIGLLNMYQRYEVEYCMLGNLT